MSDYEFFIVEKSSEHCVLRMSVNTSASIAQIVSIVEKRSALRWFKQKSGRRRDNNFFWASQDIKMDGFESFFLNSRRSNVDMIAEKQSVNKTKIQCSKQTPTLSWWWFHLQFQLPIPEYRTVYTTQESSWLDAQDRWKSKVKMSLSLWVSCIEPAIAHPTFSFSNQHKKVNMNEWQISAVTMLILLSLACQELVCRVNLNMVSSRVQGRSFW